MAGEHSAAEIIRASVQALPAVFSGPWTSIGHAVVPCGGHEKAYQVAYCGFPESARLAALLASPDVALALAELLDAASALDAAWRQTDGASNAVVAMAVVGNVLDARDALEAAICRSGT